MANEGYHEPIAELSDETRDMHRAITSLMEELEEALGLDPGRPDAGIMKGRNRQRAKREKAGLLGQRFIDEH